MKCRLVAVYEANNNKVEQQELATETIKNINNECYGRVDCRASMCENI